MGALSSKGDRRAAPDDRGVRGLLEDVETINKIAPCFRLDGMQLHFARSQTNQGLNDANYVQTARVGVKRVNIDGSDAMPGGAYKPLTYRQFLRVLKRMKDDADVALQAQMALRGFVEPSRAVATRVLMEDGNIVSLEEAEQRRKAAGLSPQNAARGEDG
eukprot:CAMPEP_0180269030 /NCGR_PEP_ID=MMETSP0988-20121125/2425_1 /TAXON_ID=697907 /ORGANISM="non described non described, Strain CCMP2293" /LENGTH=159 /DNA_ID=CAMNT_0022239869 /DNA_START=156 /DNA_END=632 /DNA_ORIENTATION=+